MWMSEPSSARMRTIRLRQGLIPEPFSCEPQHPNQDTIPPLEYVASVCSSTTLWTPVMRECSCAHLSTISLNLDAACLFPSLSSALALNATLITRTAGMTMRVRPHSLSIQWEGSVYCSGRGTRTCLCVCLCVCSPGVWVRVPGWACAVRPRMTALYPGGSWSHAASCPNGQRRRERESV